MLDLWFYDFVIAIKLPQQTWKELKLIFQRPTCTFLSLFCCMFESFEYQIIDFFRNYFLYSPIDSFAGNSRQLHELRQIQRTASVNKFISSYIWENFYLFIFFFTFDLFFAQNLVDENSDRISSVLVLYLSDSFAR